MKRILATTCAALLFSAGAVVAQDAPKPPDKGGGDTCLETIEVIDCVEISPGLFKCTVIAKEVPCD